MIGLKKGLRGITHIINSLPSIDINFEYNPEEGTNDVILNGENVEQDIRAMKVSEHVSSVAKN